MSFLLRIGSRSIITALQAYFGSGEKSNFYAGTPPPFIHAVQQDTQSVLMSKFYSALVLANAPDDGPVRSETCRANTSAE